MSSLSAEQVEVLAEKKLLGTITPAEQSLLNEWLNQLPGEEIIWDSGDVDEKALKERLLARIKEDAGIHQPAVPVRRLHFPRRTWWVAAAVLLIIGGGLFMWMQSAEEKIEITKNQFPQQDVLPGHNGAVLTLSGGKQIVLDSVRNGALALQGHTTIQHQDGRLLYEPTSKNDEVLYNSITTAKGRQYQLVLSDGTKVWLNAASSIRYPAMFTGRERRVEITGEVYFEVAKNKAMPFKVKVNDITEVEVLGTQFNINAYNDEPTINTTLLEGSVKVTTDLSVHESRLTSHVLIPGQQAQIDHKGTAIHLVQHANVEQAVAWKEGLFSFTDADLPTIMRQLARWYDVEVEYAGTIPVRKFNGEIGKTLTLSQVLNGLTKTRVNYRIENGKKIIIFP